jgi:hypothetical protein
MALLFRRRPNSDGEAPQLAAAGPAAVRYLVPDTERGMPLPATTPD